MRLPERKIKSALQHPEEEVRYIALRYFTRSSRPDESIMPLVIESVGRYGMDIAAFRLLRAADCLPQTEATMAWLIDELHRELDLTTIAHDNYRFAVALILCNVRPELLVRHQARIVKAPLFPQQLQGCLNEKLEIASWSWDRTWSEFIRLANQLSRRDESMSRSDHRRMYEFVEMLALHRESSEQVLALLRRRHHGIDAGLAYWIEPWTVELAGRMRLEAAIPYLIEWSHLAENDVADECGGALGRIGTDRVVEAIAGDWECGSFDFRMIATEAMWYIHTDLCAEKSLEFLLGERDHEIRLMLGEVVLSHFLFEGIQPVRRLVLGDADQLDAEQFGLRYHLTAAATIMGASFPEYEQWHEDALMTDYGWGEREERRIAENIQT